MQGVGIKNKIYIEKMTDREALDILKQTLIQHGDYFDLDKYETNSILNEFSATDKINDGFIEKLDSHFLNRVRFAEKLFMFAFLENKEFSVFHDMCLDYYARKRGEFIYGAAKYFYFLFDNSGEDYKKLIASIIEELENNNLNKAEEFYQELYLHSDFPLVELELDVTDDLDEIGENVWMWFALDGKELSYDEHLRKKWFENRCDIDYPSHYLSTSRKDWALRKKRLKKIL